MVQVLEVIKLKGGAQVELLATPALFSIAKRKGWKIEADATSAAEVYSAYSKLIYLAALNAWEVRRYDAPEMGEFQYTLMDFAEWCSEDPKRFGKTVNFIVCALTNKEMKEYATETAKGSENEEKPQDEEAVKKKSICGWIMSLLKRS